MSKNIYMSMAVALGAIQATLQNQLHGDHAVQVTTAIQELKELAAEYEPRAEAPRTLEDVASTGRVAVAPGGGSNTQTTLHADTDASVAAQPIAPADQVAPGTIQATRQPVGPDAAGVTRNADGKVLDAPMGSVDAALSGVTKSGDLTTSAHGTVREALPGEVDAALDKQAAEHEAEDDPAAGRQPGGDAAPVEEPDGPQPDGVNPRELPEARVGRGVTISFSAEGVRTWALEDNGDVPKGMVLTEGGVLHGTPGDDDAGDWEFELVGSGPVPTDDESVLDGIGEVVRVNRTLVVLAADA